jgi:hypothetical protein
MKCVRNKSALLYVENGALIESEIILKCSLLSDMEKDHHINTMIANTNCIEILKLKRGTAVMCTANIDLESGICNGSQGVIVDFFANDPVVLFSNGMRKIIAKHEWQSDEYPALTIAQYPLCMAWAMTIHKIQGATMSMAEMDLGNSVFEYGQTYVALSRIKSLDGLYLSAFKADKIKANPKVTKFYREIPVIDCSKIIDKPLGDLASAVDTNVSPDVKTIDFDRFAYKEPDVMTKPSIKVIRVPKKTTDKVSLEMFMEGKSIDEIAMSRRIKSETVMEHLLNNMPHESITFDKFMNTETYEYIKDAYKVLGSESSLKVIKDHLPRYVSYTQIKVVRNLLFPASVIV